MTVNRPILYLRYERTDDPVALDQLDEEFIENHPDVQAYYDEACTSKAGRYPWHYSDLPMPESAVIWLNCAEWSVVWVETETVCA